MKTKENKNIINAVIIGAKWRDKYNGVIYCNSKVIIDGKVYYTGIDYGGIDYYIQAAKEFIYKMYGSNVEINYNTTEFFTKKHILRNNDF